MIDLALNTSRIQKKTKICHFLFPFNPAIVLPLKVHKVLIRLFNLLHSFQLLYVAKLMHLPESIVLFPFLLLKNSYVFF